MYVVFGLVLLCTAVGAQIYNPHRTKRCKNSDAYYFNVQPKGITVREGGRAFLECNVSNRCNIQFQWTLNSRLVLNNTRRYQNGSNLVITRVNRTQDSGDFHCVATYMATGISKESAPAQLSVLWLSTNASVHLEHPPRPQLDSGGADQMRLLCSVAGSDDLSYKWFLNGRRLKRDDKYEIKRNRLTVPSPTHKDNGVYSCEAENSAGVVRSSENMVLDIAGENVPRIKIVPSDQVSKLGSQVVFDCEFINASSEWRKVAKPNIDFGSSGRIRRISNGSLLVEEIISSDVGSYECFSETKNSLQAYSAYLNLAFLGEFRSTSFEPVRHLYVVGIGKRFRVACVPPDGFPEPETYWIRNGERLGNSGRIMAEGLQLVIDSAVMADAGDYVCVCENLAGKRERRLELFTSKMPTITYHPDSLDVLEGDSAFFRCEYKGSDYPVTVVDWEKNGDPLSTGMRSMDKVQRIQYHTNNGTLYIQRLKLTDAGDYSCVVRTADQPHVRSKVGHLRIKEKLKFVPKPVDKKFELGTNARIHCSAAGHMPPKVKWVQIARLNVDGNITERFARPVDNWPAGKIRSDKNGTLWFRRVEFADAGLYMCVAINMQGIINETIRVQVYVAPQFLSQPQDHTVTEGSDVWFHCDAKGTPKPQVHWYFEGATPDSSAWSFGNYQLFANNSLVIRHSTVENAGKYVCMAGNKGGFRRSEGLLCIKISKTNYTHCGRQVGFQPDSRFDAQVPLDGNHPPPEKGVSPTMVVIACGGAAGYILLVACVLVYCNHRRKSSAVKTAANGADAALRGPLVATGQTGEVVANGQMMLERPNSGTPALLRHSPRTTSSGKSSPLDKMQFPRDKLDGIQALGYGIFGEVFMTSAYGICHEHQWTLVLVKALAVKDDIVHEKLKDEMEMFRISDHPNLVRLLGICKEQEPIFVIYEHLELGSLKHYLSVSKHYTCRPQNGFSPNAAVPLSPAQLVSIAYQVAQGMEHISDKRFVHRDLAARNVVLSPALEAKITSLSLQNDTFLQEYFTYRNVVFPLRWMPAEALFDDEWSMLSDVWSFGIFLWELYTCGELPYQQNSNDEVIEGLKSSMLRLSPPPTAPPAAAQLMLSCWQTDPRLRPTFTEIRDVIGELHVETGL